MNTKDFMGVTRDRAMEVIASDDFKKYVEEMMEEKFNESSLIVEEKGSIIVCSYKCEDGYVGKVNTFYLI